MSAASVTKPTALITGIRGFTGPYVERELQQAGYTVVGLSNTEVAHNESIHTVDLCDREAIASVIHSIKPDVVIHLAAISFVAHGDVGEIYNSNVVGTHNLLTALAESSHSPRSVILASSANIYGNASSAALHEQSTPNPMNDYAVSKLSMEYMASLWFDRLPVTIVRPFNYTGIGQSEKFLIAKIVAHYRQKQPSILLGNLDVWRDFSDVRFIASAYAKLAQLAPSGEKINLCSGVSYSLHQVIADMNEIAGYDIEIGVNPDLVRNNEVSKLVGDNDKLFSLVGEFEQRPFIETLRWMYEGDA